MKKITKIDEQKWQNFWEEQGWYPAEDLDKKREKIYVLVEFPYPSGSGLHVGHAFSMVGADVYARKKRMEGKNVLFPMGWDAFGLPTENYAIKTGRPPQEVTKENTDNFRRQMKKLALSFDWRRGINTTDPRYYHWTQWIFIQLFKKGLAYKRKMPINWCPSCKIGLANEEVIRKKNEKGEYVNVCERCGAEVERREISQWVVKITDYADRLLRGLEKVDFVEKVKAAQINWIGKSEGARVKFKIQNSKLKIKEIEVFTTRPDTLWGATFMVLAPEHPLVATLLDSDSSISDSKRREIERYIEQARKKSDLERTELAKEKTGVFSGLYAVNPVNNKKIPIWISDFVLSSYGTGAIMAVPAHDERDHAFAVKYHLPIIPVVQPPQKWDFNKEAYVDVDRGKMINSGPLNGLKPSEAIKKAIEILKKRKVGQRAVSYHLRDWIFSRQHYWGEPIPMIYCEHCAKKGIVWWDTSEGKKFLRKNSKFEILSSKQIRNSESSNSRPPRGDLAGWFPVPEDQLPVVLPKVKKYQPTDTGESPLAVMSNWVAAKCPVCGRPAKRETDTMPNWAGSDWYFLAYTFWHLLREEKTPDNVFRRYQKNLKYWLPVDIYFGGDEHNTLHLLYSRFIYQFLWDIGAVPKEYPEPYRRRVSHGLILGEDGQKMSKSRGNVVNPDDVWRQFGVDALRVYLMFMGPYEGTMNWNNQALRGVARFLERMEKYFSRRIKELKKEKGREDKKITAAINRLIKKVSEDIDKFHYNTAIAALMKFLNQVEDNDWQLSKKQMEEWLKLLAPFAPYLTEEYWWQLKGEKEKESIHWSLWPNYDRSLLAEERIEIVVQINGKKRAVVTVDTKDANNQALIEELVKKEKKVKNYLSGKKIVKIIFVPRGLINFVVR